MAHIELGVDETSFPGISGLMRYRPETAKPLNELAEVLLRAPNSMSRGDRELIAAYVSRANECQFCHNSHAAFAAAQLDGGRPFVEQVCANVDTAEVTPKLRSLLRVAGAVAVSGKAVTAELLDAARGAGATDVEIHDTVLIAAAFCMYNRYVDGLGTQPAASQEAYDESARQIVEHGYAAVVDVPAAP